MVNITCCTRTEWLNAWEAIVVRSRSCHQGKVWRYTLDIDSICKDCKKHRICCTICRRLRSLQLEGIVQEGFAIDRRTLVVSLWLGADPR